MENENIKQEETEKKEAEKKLRFSCLQVLVIIGIVAVVSALATGLWVKHYIYASPFEPTKLNAREEKVFQSKLEQLEQASFRDSATEAQNPGKKQAPGTPSQGGRLAPEAYTEEGASRQIQFTEKELNSLIAGEPELAQKVALDLSDNMLSIKLVVPMDEEILFLGGKTLRVNLGAVLSYENDNPVIALKGISLGGVPLPNAWMGNLKNKNLVEEFGSEGGFWQLFADGVKDIKVKDGHLQIELKE